MRVVIVNKSDTTGGAAMVSFRLMEALRNAGVDARMIVTEKLSGSLYVDKAAPGLLMKERFLEDTLRKYIANGRDKDTMFKIDTGDLGLPLWRHPWVKDADIVMLNWVNQGMLSLKGIDKILKKGKKIIWTMHDLWCMTGICHHPYGCINFYEKCGECEWLNCEKSAPDDFSARVWKNKEDLYFSPEGEKIVFVAVSNWLAEMAKKSSLLGNKKVEVIPNALPITSAFPARTKKNKGEKIKILFGAARIDDPIKGYRTLEAALKILKNEYPEVASEIELITFGEIKRPYYFSWLDNESGLSHTHLGMLRGEEEIRKVYAEGDILLSTSLWETLPTTLMEAQLYGCVPVSLDRGGQPDIVDHLSTGYLIDARGAMEEVARNLIKGILWAIDQIRSDEYENMILRMRESVEKRFAPAVVAQQYINLINKMMEEK